jgi:hypothetical protein
MHEINHLSSDRMTPEQRRREVASLLANGLVRLRSTWSPKSSNGLRESEFVLGFAPQQSVHTVSTNNTNTESK